MSNKKNPSLLRKISVTLLCILGSTGVIYFFEIFNNFNSHKADHLLWAIFFGIAFAYFLDYKLEITTRVKSKEENELKK